MSKKTKTNFTLTNFITQAPPEILDGLQLDFKSKRNLILSSSVIRRNFPFTLTELKTAKNAIGDKVTELEVKISDLENKIRNKEDERDGYPESSRWYRDRMKNYSKKLTKLEGELSEKKLQHDKLISSGKLLLKQIENLKKKGKSRKKSRKKSHKKSRKKSRKR